MKERSNSSSVSTGVSISKQRARARDTSSANHGELFMGDGQSILGNYIIQDLCHDLDALLQQDNPAPEILDHAIWMASKLHMKNVVRFLELVGAPAGKYELGY